MQTIVIKRKKFEVIEQLGENSFKVKKGKKFYFVKRFGENEEAFFNFKKVCSDIYNLGVPCPEVCIADKKTFDIALTYIDGVNAFEYLTKNHITDKQLENLYRANWIAKLNKGAIDFDPDKWMFAGDKVYYIAYTLGTYSEKDKDKLINGDIKKWYFTKEFRAFAAEKGVEIDKSLIKTEFEANREIMLAACKYYK